MDYAGGQMTNISNISEVRIRKVWEWSGLTCKVENDTEYWYAPDGAYINHGIPNSPIPKVPLSLDNLFQYAMPKVLEKIGKSKSVALVNNAICDSIEHTGEVKDYLFLAVEKTMKEDRGYNISEYRIRKLWEWCGLQHYMNCQGSPFKLPSWVTLSGWYYGERLIGRDMPKLDLNNIFKYALPKLDGYVLSESIENPVGMSAEVRICNRYSNRIDRDPVVAMFIAIENIIETQENA